MSTNIESNAQDDGCFWYPFRPSFRWPMRLLAIFMILGALQIGLTVNQWRWSYFAIPSALLIWSFQTPYRRRKTASYYLGITLLYAAIATAAVLVIYLM
jgi:hypothetical protein